MRRVLVELHYLPCIAYFSLLSKFDEIVIEQHENYNKQSYRNRCRILGANRVEQLVIPLTGKHGKTKIRDVQIDYTQRWQNNHWRSIESAYRKAPYFEHYADELRETLYFAPPYLFNFNKNLLEKCLTWLGYAPTILFSRTFDKSPEGVTDLRDQIHPKHGGKSLSYFQPAAYHQVFGETFVENLSIIDLIFCQGPEAVSIVRRSMKGA